MDKQNVVYACYVLCFSLQKEGNSDTYYIIDVEDMILSEISQSQKRQILHDSNFMRVLEESYSQKGKSIMVCRSWGKIKREVVVQWV